MQNGLGNYSHSMPSDFWDRVAREVASRIVGQYGGLGQLGSLNQAHNQAQAGIRGISPEMQQGVGLPRLQSSGFHAVEQRTVT